MDLQYTKFLLEKTKADYNLIAQDFSSKRKEIWEELLFLFEDLKEGEKVLDLGCGNGRWFKIFKEKKIKYIGIDNSEKLIEIAKKNFPEANFLVADALNLPFPENYFDKVFAIAILHHIPSESFRIQFLKQVKRVLKPKGKLILTVWKLHQLKEKLLILKYTILKIIGKSKLDFKDIFEPWGKKLQRYYHCFSKRELKKLVEKVNFKILKIGEVKNKRKNRQNFYLICEKIT
jgi:ubiquinone/menaquinone biosynthesis C-methylase UbiE